MEKLEISRNGETDQFSIVLFQGDDTIRCMVTVASGYGKGADSHRDKERSALLKAKALAKALDEAIEAD